MDNLTLEQRKHNMSQIRSNNTKPEIKFRKYIWNKGLRGYKLKAKLPGKPDLYFPKKRLAVFIDGCFWHQCPQDFVRPKSRNDYWDNKINANIERDKRVNQELNERGIRVLRIWEHEVKKDLDSSYLKLKDLYENEEEI